MPLTPAQQLIVTANKKQAKDAAKHAHGLNPEIPFNDYLQSAHLALCIAVLNYNSAKCSSFSTYAYRCIHTEFKQLALDYGTHFITAGAWMRVNKHSLNQSFNEDGDCLLDHLPDCNTQADTIRQENEKEQRIFVDNALSLLNPLQRDVLTLHYGLDGNDALTIKEIAQLLNISPVYATQLHQKALNIIKINS